MPFNILGKSKANKKQKLPEFKGMNEVDLDNDNAKVFKSDPEQIEVAPPQKRHKTSLPNVSVDGANAKKNSKPFAIKEEASASESETEQMEVASPAERHKVSRGNVPNVAEDFAIVANLSKICSKKDVEALLTSHGLAANRIQMVYSPVAVVAIPQGDMQHFCEALNGVQYKNQKVCCMPVANSNAVHLFTEVSNSDSVKHDADPKSLYISKVPFDVTEKELADVVKDKQATITLLNTFRSKPDHVSGAKVTFPSESHAAEALQKLHDVKVRGMKVIVKPFAPNNPKKSRVLEAKNSIPTHQNKFLYVSNLPFNLTQEQVADHFPDAKDVQLVIRDGKNIGKCYLTFATSEDCTRVLQACQNKSIGGRQIKAFPCREPLPKNTTQEKRPHSEFVVRVWSIPYTSTKEDLQVHYPMAQQIIMLKTPDNKPKGAALLIFQNASQCQEAVKKTATLRINGRQLGAEVQQPRHLDIAGNGAMTRKRPAETEKEDEQRPLKKEKFGLEEPEEEKDSDEEEYDDSEDEEDGENEDNEDDDEDDDSSD